MLTFIALHGLGVAVAVAIGVAAAWIVAEMGGRS